MYDNLYPVTRRYSPYDKDCFLAKEKSFFIEPFKLRMVIIIVPQMDPHNKVTPAYKETYLEMFRY